MSNNSITSAGAIKLLGCLKNLSNLYWLNIASNKIDDECMDALAEMLIDHNSCKIVSLGDASSTSNLITDEGICRLVHGITRNTILREIYLTKSTQITDNSVPQLVALIRNTNIQRIEVSDTSISEAGKREIENALKIPIDGRSIPISSTTKSAAKLQ